LAAYLNNDDEISIVDEHVEELTLDDEPDLVVIQAYITSAYRSYQIADHYRNKGCYVVMGGLHVTSLPDEAAQHADTIILGPAGDAWTRFLTDFRARCPEKRYVASVRTLDGRLRKLLITKLILDFMPLSTPSLSKPDRQDKAGALLVATLCLYDGNHGHVQAHLQSGSPAKFRQNQRH